MLVAGAINVKSFADDVKLTLFTSLQLEELDLSRNDFSEGLNPAIGRLGRLKKLSLSSCKLKVVPDWIESLQVVCTFCTDVFIRCGWFLPTSNKNASARLQLAMNWLKCVAQSMYYALFMLIMVFLAAICVVSVENIEIIYEHG